MEYKQGTSVATWGSILQPYDEGRKQLSTKAAAWLHLFEVRKQTKLMYGGSAQGGVYLWKEGID